MRSLSLITSKDFDHRSSLEAAFGFISMVISIDTNVIYKQYVELSDTLYLSHPLKMLDRGTVILNAGYRGGRIFYTSSKSFLPHSRNSVKFDTPFQHSKKILYPLLTPLLSAWIH